MSTSMNGKTVLITGATNGLGRFSARELAGMGAQVVLVSRSPEKCAQVVQQIKRETGNAQVSSIAADLSTRAGAHQAAHEFKKRHPRLDILMNNAGALFVSRQLSTDSIEMTFALNHLGYFLLTILLLDTLKASGPARIINISSDAHRRAKIDFDNLQMEKGYNGLAAYNQSKLANVLFTYELARKLEGSRVTANAVHPGFVNTGFAKNNGWWIKYAMSLFIPIQRSLKHAAQTGIYLACSPEVEGVTGKYFDNSRAIPSSPASYNQATAECLWHMSLEMIA